MMYHCIPIGCFSPSHTELLKNGLHRAVHSQVHQPQKNATVTSTTQVVDTTSSRVGQVICFNSKRVSWRNSLVSASVREIFSPRPAAAPVMALPSPFLTFTACVAIFPSITSCGSSGLSLVPARPVSYKERSTLAGEEGFAPPYPVLETGVLTVGRLP